jgi:hypothetical protein
MSTIAYKNRVMAADTRAYGGSYNATPGSKTKIHELPDGSLIGAITSDIGQGERYVAWVRAGANVADWQGALPDCDVMLVKPDGTMWLAVSSLHFSGPIETTGYAIGSGAKYAIGAMACGRSAKAAVVVACDLCAHTGGYVQTLRLKNPK